jgi:hypothetical protein
MDEGKRSGSSGEASRWFGALIGVVNEAIAAQVPITAESLTVALCGRFGVPARRLAAAMTGMEAVAEYVFAELEPDGDSLAEEASALAAAKRTVRSGFEARLQERLDRIDTEKPGALACGAEACGLTLHSAGRPARSWSSTLGDITLKRRRSRCEHAGHGPGRSYSQEKLLLPEGPFTAELSDALTRLATTVPHGMACLLAGRLLGVKVSEHAVQDEVETRAVPLMAADEAQSHDLNPLDPRGLERLVDRPKAEVAVPPAVAYIEIDGVLPMTRQEDAKRSQPVPETRGGKGRRYVLEGKEVKNAVLYTDVDAARESANRGCLLKKRYVSSLGHWMPFALLLWVQMLKLRFDQAKLIVVLSDGAHWIRELAAWLPCSAHVLLILDLYHAIHRMYEVAHAVFGDGPMGKEWRQKQKDDIAAGRVRHVIDRLRFLKPTSSDGIKKVGELITYFENNADRMDYPTYVARGLRVSSAAVESANFHVTGARMKAQGMRWSELGAAQMARLRADLFNGDWEARTRQALAA